MIPRFDFQHAILSSVSFSQSDAVVGKNLDASFLKSFDDADQIVRDRSSRASLEVCNCLTRDICSPCQIILTPSEHCTSSTALLSAKIRYPILIILIDVNQFV
jgi:hypothetical protein